jgi:hypothetical protein
MQLKEKSLLNSIIVQIPGNMVSDMDGEIIMFNMENGKYYNLGSLGGVIWEMLKVPTSFDSLVITLLSEYEVEREVCEDEVYRFVENLYLEGLISVTQRSK